MSGHYTAHWARTGHFALTWLEWRHYSYPTNNALFVDPKLTQLGCASNLSYMKQRQTGDCTRRVTFFCRPAEHAARHGSWRLNFAGGGLGVDQRVADQARATSTDWASADRPFDIWLRRLTSRSSQCGLGRQRRSASELTLGSV
jgi:hypothetical protein